MRVVVMVVVIGSLGSFDGIVRLWTTNCGLSTTVSAQNECSTDPPHTYSHKTWITPRILQLYIPIRTRPAAAAAANTALTVGLMPSPWTAVYRWSAVICQADRPHRDGSVYPGASCTAQNCGRCHCPVRGLGEQRLQHSDLRHAHNRVLVPISRTRQLPGVAYVHREHVSR